MRRRRFLAATAAATALPLAGCSTLGFGTTDLSPTRETGDTNETHLHFDRDGERLLTFTVGYPRSYGDSPDRVPLQFDAWHADGTRIEAFRLAVLAHGDEGDPAPTVALETPWIGEGPVLDFYRTRDGETVVAADGLGEHGDATLTVGLRVDPLGTPDDLSVRVTGAFDLSEGGALDRTYSAEGRTAVEIARASER